MAVITIATGEIDNYEGAETAPLLRWFISKTVTASDGDTIPKSSLEDGVFYKEVVCSVAGTVITYPAHTIDSTLDATPANAKLTLALYKANGTDRIAILFKGLQVPAAPTTTTLEDILVLNEDPITPAVAGSYTTTQTDALIAGLQTQIDDVADDMIGLTIAISQGNIQL